MNGLSCFSSSFRYPPRPNCCFFLLSDYNFAPDGNDCLLAGPETVPAGACARENDLFSGSSGFRLIPGNTCDVRNGIKKDTPVMKSCHAAVETPGLISHSIVSCHCDIELCAELIVPQSLLVLIPWYRSRSIIFF